MIAVHDIYAVANNATPWLIVHKGTLANCTHWISVPKRLGAGWQITLWKVKG